MLEALDPITLLKSLIDMLASKLEQLSGLTANRELGKSRLKQHPDCRPSDTASFWQGMRHPWLEESNLTEGQRGLWSFVGTHSCVR